MKKYIKPELNTTLFETEDVITASGDLPVTSADTPSTYDGAVKLGTISANAFGE